MLLLAVEEPAVLLSSSLEKLSADLRSHFLLQSNKERNFTSIFFHNKTVKCHKVPFEEKKMIN